MTARPGDRPLYRYEKFGLVLVGLLIVGYGAITEVRSAFLSFRHTDFNCYTHAGWAVRSGADLYGELAVNGLPYTYPCTFAVLMVPLAEPPPWVPNDGTYVPFAVSVAIWYVVSVAFGMWAVHLLAAAVLPGAARGSRRWWYARTVPFYACIGGIGFSLGRGQVNVLLVAMFAAMFAAAVRGRRTASGMWLGGAIALKLIPAFLVLFPVVRRDWRSGVGAAALAVALGVIPVAVWGPPRTVELHTFFVKYVVLAGTMGGADQPVGKALTETTATDSQSFQAAIHHLRHWDLPREERPLNASPGTRLAHLAISGALTLATLWVAYRRLTPDPSDQLVFFGCLCGLLMVVAPVSHMHFYAFVLPLVAGLWLRGLALRPGEVSAPLKTTLAVAGWGVATALPLFPGVPFDQLRECGFGAAATVALWAVGLRAIGRPPAKPVVAVPTPGPVRMAA
ncbi:MAG: DUF2029 domain-containing protein [Gemmataceae bacterium]|nr:DUF2029 domain-containing protein [Gemmataceae bacterium]